MMEKTNYEKHRLEKGEVYVYDYGKVKLHVYKTNDAIGDVTFIFEKEGEAVVLEPPCFYDNIHALTTYVSTLRSKVVAKLCAYHMAGGTFLPEVPTYTTEKAKEYSYHGGGKGLIDFFTKCYGNDFDSTFAAVVNMITESEIDFAGITFHLVETDNAFDVEVPQCNVYYTHVLGHDCHSVVRSSEHADIMVAQLNGYLQKEYDFILSSHSTPEDLKDVKIKIDYLEDIKAIAQISTNCAIFKASVEKKYPAYSGENYLVKTCELLYPQ